MGLDAWMRTQAHRELLRLLIAAVVITATLAWTVYGR